MPDAGGFKYAYSTSHIENILAKIRDTGRPDKLTITHVTNEWLLKNNQYTAVLDILRAMNFIDSSGVPQDRYAKYQNDSLSKSVLADGIREAYSSLFKTYPNAHELDRDTLKGYFKQNTGAEKSVVDKLLTTFNKLCSMADFDQGSKQEIADEKPSKGSKRDESKTTFPIPVTMNVQIVLPSDATPEQYDNIFASIRKHFGQH